MSSVLDALKKLTKEKNELTKALVFLFLYIKEMPVEFELIMLVFTTSMCFYCLKHKKASLMFVLSVFGTLILYINQIKILDFLIKVEKMMIKEFDLEKIPILVRLIEFMNAKPGFVMFIIAIFLVFLLFFNPIFYKHVFPFVFIFILSKIYFEPVLVRFAPNNPPDVYLACLIVFSLLLALSKLFFVNFVNDIAVCAFTSFLVFMHVIRHSELFKNAESVLRQACNGEKKVLYCDVTIYFVILTIFIYIVQKLVHKKRKNKKVE